MEPPDNTAAGQLAAGGSLGPYSIERTLGRGGMAEVYSARDTRLGRTVAIKILRSEFARREDFRQRFEREGRAISALNHPHICSLYDVGEQDGFAYLVMEYRARLLLEAGPARGVAGNFRRQDFQSHVTPEARIPRAVNLTHSARTQGCQDFVRAELVA